MQAAPSQPCDIGRETGKYAEGFFAWRNSGTKLSSSPAFLLHALCRYGDKQAAIGALFCAGADHNHRAFWQEAGSGGVLSRA